MKHTISWISTSWVTASVLAASVGLGCQTEEQVAAPVTAVEQQPVTAVDQQPAMAVDQQPATAVDQQPAMAVDQEPATAVVQQPRAVEQEPKRAAPVQQDPGAPEFLPNAFPPIVPDTEWHRDAWMQASCLRCHETGVGDAPELVHDGMPAILLEAKCRTCHVFVPGAKPRLKPEATEPPRFEEWAFPPLVPASDYHRDAWLRGDCLLCHENGVKGAPRIEHRGMPRLLIESKCRTCHVQIRAIELDGK